MHKIAHYSLKLPKCREENNEVIIYLKADNPSHHSFPPPVCTYLHPTAVEGLAVKSSFCNMTGSTSQEDDDISKHRRQLANGMALILCPEIWIWKHVWNTFVWYRGKIGIKVNS